MRHHHHPHCGCPVCKKSTKQVVHPVKQNVVHCNTEETIQHVHPSHTTVKNHHVVKNEHVYPHSTSVENSADCMDVYGGNCNCNKPPRPGNHMKGPMHHGNKHWNKHNKWC